MKKWTITKDPINGMSATEGVITKTTHATTVILGQVETPTPNNCGCLMVKGKQYPDYKVAKALYAQQITIDDISVVEETQL